MMRLSLLRTGLLTLAIGCMTVPTAYAQSNESGYIGPEFLFSPDVQAKMQAFKNGEAAGNARLTGRIAAQDAAERQAKADAAMHAAAPAAPDDAASTSPDYSNTDTTTTDDTYIPETDGTSQGQAIDPVTYRLLLRIQSQNQQRAAANQTGVLHSSAYDQGAPLAGTGPGMAVLFLAAGCALAWTLLRARKLEEMRMW